MNKSDGVKQPILNKWVGITLLMLLLEQLYACNNKYGFQDQMEHLFCKECGLPDVENMRRDEFRDLLSSQPDFSSVKPEIQEYVEHRGHILLFGPKCHPECIHIEMCWATILQTALWS